MAIKHQPAGDQRTDNLPAWELLPVSSNER
jgi:hypothetical protein